MPQLDQYYSLSSNSLGKLEIKRISVGDLYSLESVLSVEQTPESFVVCLLKHQLKNSDFPIQKIADLETKELAKLARQLASAEGYDLGKGSDKETIESLREKIAERIKHHNDAATSTIESLKALQKQWGDQIEPHIESLFKYRWFISPSMPMDLVKAMVAAVKKPKSREVLDNLMTKFFSGNRWEWMQLFIQEWSKAPSLKEERLQIISDCLACLQSDGLTEKQALNATIPTLISQIEGAGKDYARCVGWSDANIVEILENVLSRKNNIPEYAIKFMIDELFGESGKAINPASLNRHKILHGKNVDYAYPLNLIRIIMILDVLAFMQRREIEKLERASRKTPIV